MKTFISVITIIIGLLVSISSLGWGFKGHVLIAQIAYDNLSPQARNEVDSLSSIIYNHLSQRKKERLDRYYKSVSAYARLAVLPDTWRRWKLKTIFHHFNAPIPSSLVSLQFKRTGSWHFINQPYPNES